MYTGKSLAPFCDCQTRSWLPAGASLLASTVFSRLPFLAVLHYLANADGLSVRCAALLLPQGNAAHLAARIHLLAGEGLS